jgi:hypothetical protein
MATSRSDSGDHKFPCISGVDVERDFLEKNGGARVAEYVCEAVMGFDSIVGDIFVFVFMVCI